MARYYGQYDSIRLRGNLLVDEDATFSGDFAITGAVTITGNWTVVGTLTVGTSGAGEAVTFYGDNANSDFVWAEAGDTNGSLTLGATTDSVDFRVYGATASTYLHWDGSVDDLLLVGTASRISVAGTDETSSGATGAIHTAGGIGAAKKVFVGTDIIMAGGDLNMNTATTGVYDIVLTTNQADALSIKDSAADLIVFNTTTGTPVVTITPITTISGVLTLSGGLTFDAALDVTVAADTAAALEFYDGTTKFLVFDSRDTVTGVTNVLFTGMPATITAAATVAKNTVSIAAGATTFSGATGITTPLDGIALTIAAPTLVAATAAVTQASSVYIAGEPTISGGGSLATAYAVEINSGNMLTAGQIIISEATAASSLATGSIQVAGGIAVTKASWFGTDLNFTTAAMDFVFKAGTAAALEFYDGTTKALVVSTVVDASAVTNFTFNGMPATIASGAAVHWHLMGLVPGTVSFTGTTQVTTEVDGVALNIAAPTLAGDGGLTVDQASTVYIAAAPIASTLTITAGYALEIASGNMLTAGRIITSEATAASSLATGSVQVAGGIAVTKTSWFGTDLNFTTAAMDFVFSADTAAALEFNDGTTKALVLNTQVTTSGITNFTLNGMPATIASASGANWHLAGLVPGTTTYSGTTNITTPIDGVALHVSQPTLAGGATTITQASTVYIAAEPVKGGSVTAITNAYALHVDSGMTKLDGGVTFTMDVENIGVPTMVSEAVTYASSGALWTIADGEIWVIHGLWLNVTVNFDSGGSDDNTLQVGDGGDANGLLDMVDAELQAAAAQVTGAEAGWHGSMAACLGAYMADGMFVYAPSGTDETIDIVTGGTGADAGAGTLYMLYTRIQ